MAEVIYRNGDCDVRDTGNGDYGFYQVHIGGVCDAEFHKDNPRAYKDAWRYCNRVAKERRTKPDKLNTIPILLAELEAKESETLNLVSQVATLKAELEASKTREDVLKQTLENAKEVAIQAIELGRFRLLTQVEDNILKGTKAGAHWIANHDRALVLQSVMPELSAFIRGLDTATGVSE